MHDVVLDALAKGGGGGGGAAGAAIETYFSSAFPSIFIPTAAIVAIVFALFMWWRVSQISVGGSGGNREYLLEAGGDEEVGGPLATEGNSHDTHTPGHARKNVGGAQRGARARMGPKRLPASAPGGAAVHAGAPLRRAGRARRLFGESGVSRKKKDPPLGSSIISRDSEDSPPAPSPSSASSFG
jgi:hypothetical protein